MIQKCKKDYNILYWILIFQVFVCGSYWENEYWLSIGGNIPQYASLIIVDFSDLHLLPVNVTVELMWNIRSNYERINFKSMRSQIKLEFDYRTYTGKLEISNCGGHVDSVPSSAMQLAWTESALSDISRVDFLCWPRVINWWCFLSFLIYKFKKSMAIKMNLTGLWIYNIISKLI